MTALSSENLKTVLTQADPSKRLVISPLLDPARQLKPNQAAVDVRLGRAFSIARPWAQGIAEALRSPSAEPPMETLVLDFGEPFIIHPHQFVLARTLEVVRLPTDLIAYVVGRSSWGRRGLIVATAVVVHPGFAGPITLELKNVAEVPLAVYPLDCVAQLVFHQVGPGGADAAQSSQFASTYSPGLGKMRDPTTEKVIEGLLRSRQP